MDRGGDAKERERLLLRVHEAAAMLGIGRTKTYELIGRGELHVVHIDGAARVSARCRPPAIRAASEAAAPSTPTSGR